MTPKEIRALDPISYEEAHISFLREIAAQLAELNKNLKNFAPKLNAEKTETEVSQVK